MASPLRIAVLAAIGRNPVSGAARPNPDDVVALEVARGFGDDVTVLHAGDGAEPAIGDYLAYGATRLDVLPASARSDVAATLAERLSGFDLILTGSRSEGGEGSGLVPYLVAERLGLPIVGQALEVVLTDGHAEVTQFMPKGQRRKVRVKLPAVIAIHPMAPVAPRYAYARRVAGKIAQQPAAQDVEQGAVAWRVAPATKKPVKFKAAETKAGHARMLSAIVTEAKGGAVVNTGTPADKARAILAYLREHRLIDW